MHKHHCTCELCMSYSSCMFLFGIVLHAVHVVFTCYARAVHLLCVRTGLNRFKLVLTRFPAKCVLNHISPEMCRDACPCLVLFCMLYTCCARVVRQKRFKPGKTQEKNAPSAVATGYINRSATANAITTVLRSLQSTSIEYQSRSNTSRCRDGSGTPSFVSIYYILSLFVRMLTNT